MIEPGFHAFDLCRNLIGTVFIKLFNLLIFLVNYNYISLWKKSIEKEGAHRYTQKTHF